MEHTVGTLWPEGGWMLLYPQNSSFLSTFTHFDENKEVPHLITEKGEKKKEIARSTLTF